MANKMKKEAKVLGCGLLADGIYELWLETPFAKDVVPGQFVGVYRVNKATLTQTHKRMRGGYREVGDKTGVQSCWKRNGGVFTLPAG